MATVTVLIEGYVKESDEGERVQATVTLVQDEGHNIIVDPGMTHDPQAITKALQTQGLRPDDIDAVFITHHHPDHTRFMGLFAKARAYDYASVYDNDLWLESGDGYAITPHATIMHTPGHTAEDATLLVSDVTNVPGHDACSVAICHLWWYEGMDDDPMAEDMAQLRQSRAKMLEVADYIVPGHGAMFMNKDKAQTHAGE